MREYVRREHVRGMRVYVRRDMYEWRVYVIGEGRV